jgi:hypothetical protein
MALSEQYCNDFNISNYLASAITSTSSTSISVNTSTGYPTTGNFRIKIDNEIMLVTAVSGTTWTVTRGYESTTAATHTSGTAVGAVLTAGAITTIRANQNQTGTYANLPSTTVAYTGDRYKATDASPYEYYFNGTSWDAYAFGHLCTPVNGSTYTLYKTSGSDFHVYTSLGGVTRLGNGGTNNGDAFFHPPSSNLPGSGDFRARLYLRRSSHSAAGTSRFGIYLYDAASGKAVCWNTDTNGTVNYYYWNDITTQNLSTTKYSTGRGASIQGFNNGVPHYLALGYHNSDIYLAISGDGSMWPADNAYSQTDFLPNRPTHMGVYLGEWSSLTMFAELLSLEVETGTTPTNYWEPFS